METWGLPLSSESSSSHPIQLVTFRHKIKNKENSQQISSLKIFLTFIFKTKCWLSCPSEQFLPSLFESRICLLTFSKKNTQLIYIGWPRKCKSYYIEPFFMITKNKSSRKGKSGTWQTFGWRLQWTGKKTNY